LPGAKANTNARCCLIIVRQLALLRKIKLDPVTEDFVIDEKALKIMLV